MAGMRTAPRLLRSTYVTMEYKVLTRAGMKTRIRLTKQGPGLKEQNPVEKTRSRLKKTESGVKAHDGWSSRCIHDAVARNRGKEGDSSNAWVPQELHSRV